MNATNKKKGFAVGSAVVLTEEYISLFENFELRLVIHEVTDVRLLNGCYVYNVAPVAPHGVDYSRVRETYASDMRAVHS